MTIRWQSKYALQKKYAHDSSQDKEHHKGMQFCISKNGKFTLYVSSGFQWLEHQLLGSEQSDCYIKGKHKS